MHGHKLRNIYTCIYSKINGKNKRTQTEENELIKNEKVQAGFESLTFSLQKLSISPSFESPVTLQYADVWKLYPVRVYTVRPDEIKISESLSLDY